MISETPNSHLLGSQIHKKVQKSFITRKGWVSWDWRQLSQRNTAVTLGRLEHSRCTPENLFPMASQRDPIFEKVSCVTRKQEGRQSLWNLSRLARLCSETCLSTTFVAVWNVKYQTETQYSSEFLLTSTQMDSLPSQSTEWCSALVHQCMASS